MILTDGLRNILNYEIARKLKQLRSAGASDRGAISKEITRLEGLTIP